ncbi:hypothetical protein Abor_035_064 [Acetobacter orientalis]|uniref:Uncharacterized protein n=1 Tax=Acetobacter orientalis TaxID=146474 RepID=A0A0D6NNQ1_9PROT|nr:hypothetical protein Abor_035_064 [Acetobacter orientalis]
MHMLPFSKEHICQVAFYAGLYGYVGYGYDSAKFGQVNGHGAVFDRLYGYGLGICTGVGCAAASGNCLLCAVAAVVLAVGLRGAMGAQQHKAERAKTYNSNAAPQEAFFLAGFGGGRG